MRETKVKNEKRIDLSRNENPIEPTFPFATESQYNKYPIDHHDLIAALAKKHNVDQKQVVVGNGSTEVLDTICRTFLGEANFILCDKFLYGPTKKSILRTGATLSMSSQEYGNDIFLVNPCCVTGRVYNPHEIEVRLHTSKEGSQRQPLVVVDEAYMEYHPQRISFINSGADIRSIVTRTFSKAYGLAGLRIGYAVCSRISDAIEIQKVQPAYNISCFSAQAAISMLDDEGYLYNTLQANEISRTLMMNNLDRLKIDRMEAAGNFICAKVSDVKGFITRELPYDGMGKWRRITLSTPEVMGEYIEQIEKDMKK